MTRLRARVAWISFRFTDLAVVAPFPFPATCSEWFVLLRTGLPRQGGEGSCLCLTLASVAAGPSLRCNQVLEFFPQRLRRMWVILVGFKFE